MASIGKMKVSLFKSPLIVEPRYARNCSPKFHAQFHVAKEEPHRPGEGGLEDPAETAL